MEYKLHIADRVTLYEALRGIRADITTIKAVRALREVLEFEPGEAEEHGITRVQNAGYFWPPEANEVTWDIEISDDMAKQIKKRLEELNDQGLLMEEHIPVYELFVDGST